MFRKIFFSTIILILLLSIGIVLFYQWNNFSLNEKNKKENQLTQEITVQHQNQEYNIKQEIQPIKSKVYQMKWPSNAMARKCYDEKKKECKWLDKQKNSMKINRQGSVTLEYTIKGSREIPYVLKNWFVQFNNVDIVSSKVQLLEKQPNSGVWVANSSNSTVKRMDYISYFVFDFKGQAGSLIWFNKPLVKKNIYPWLTVYSDKTMKIRFPNVDEIKPIKSPSKLTFVFTDEIPNTSLDSIYVMNKVDQSKIKAILLNRIIDKNLIFNENEKWLTDIITSAILSKPVGSEKAKAMYVQLYNNIGKASVKDWVNQIVEITEEQLSSKKLDEIIEKVTGKGTNFFEVNRHIDRPISKFVFFDSRKIFINGNVEKNIHIVTQKDFNLLPLITTVKALGYDVKEDKLKHTIILTKQNKEYKFSTTENIFIYNGTKFGMLSNPFTTLNQETYVDINGLSSILNLKVTETGDSILIEG